jgi:hypothetical protein
MAEDAREEKFVATYRKLTRDLHPPPARQFKLQRQQARRFGFAMAGAMKNRIPRGVRIGTSIAPSGTQEHFAES